MVRSIFGKKLLARLLTLDHKVTNYPVRREPGSRSSSGAKIQRVRPRVKPILQPTITINPAYARRKQAAFVSLAIEQLHRSVLAGTAINMVSDPSVIRSLSCYVCYLDASEAFERLAKHEKLYAHYMAQ